jgi:hypothetical protein
MNRTVRIQQLCAAGLGVLGFVCLLWGLIAHGKLSTAQDSLASDQGMYNFYELGEPGYPTWQEALTVTPTDVALGRYAQAMHTDAAAISSARIQFRVAVIIGLLSLTTMTCLLLVARRSSRTRLCPHCMSSVHRAATICPHCRAQVGGSGFPASKSTAAGSADAASGSEVTMTGTS